MKIVNMPALKRNASTLLTTTTKSHKSTVPELIDLTNDRTETTLYKQIQLKPIEHTVQLDAPEPCSYTLITQLPPQCQLNTTQFNTIWCMHPTELGTVKMFGKVIKTPRWHAQYGVDGYNFTGLTRQPLPINNVFFTDLLQYINTHCNNAMYIYRSLLVNWYECGNHYMGYHADDESVLLRDAPIYSFSYGAERLFRFQQKLDHSITYGIILPNNSCIIMSGATQRYYKHALPKMKKVSGRRINITMRVFK